MHSAPAEPDRTQQGPDDCASVLRRAGVGALAVIAFWRFILGFGIGGDYPLSATITSEYANTRWRGAFIASVFAGQVRGSV